MSRFQTQQWLIAQGTQWGADLRPSGIKSLLSLQSVGEDSRVLLSSSHKRNQRGNQSEPCTKPLPPKNLLTRRNPMNFKEKKQRLVMKSLWFINKHR